MLAKGNLKFKLISTVVLCWLTLIFSATLVQAGTTIATGHVSSYAVNKTVFWLGAFFTIFITAALVVLYMNVQSRKKLEKNLRITEAKFQQLFNSAADAIYIYDFDFRLLEANQVACERMGYSRQQLLSLRVCDFVAPELLGKFPERVARLQQQGSALFESAHVTASGQAIPVEVSSRVIEYEDSPAVLSIARDISKRKAIEQREKTRLKILEEMAKGAPLEGLLTYIVRLVELECPGALCSVQLANESGTELLHGAAPSLPEFYNQAVSGLKIRPGMGSCGTAAFLRKRVVVEDIETHPYWKGFKPARDAGLRSCWSEPVISASGDLLGTFAIYYKTCQTPSDDHIAIIESAAHMASIAIGQVRSDESRMNLEKQMRQMQKIEAIGQLAGGIAHDFNNLLTPILVYADLIKRSLPGNDENIKKIEGIILSARKATDLTQKLLSLGRKQILNMEGLDLNEVVDSLYDLLQRTIRQNIDIMTNLTPFGATVFADRGQLEQILVNLAINAQDAIQGNGRIAIETGNVVLDDEFASQNPGMKPGAYVLLSFTDNGCGMSEDVLRHVFEPFYTTKPVGHGTGLGLATAYGIVKQHGGYIKAESQVGEGTSFLIYLPKYKGEVATARLEMPSPELTPAKSAGKTVLVVDDNEMVREMAAEMLKMFGYAVKVAETPSRALEIMSSAATNIDLLVSDVVMPEMSGPDLYSRLSEQYPDLPVLYISGYIFDVKLHRSLHDEDVNFLPKPFTAEQFLISIQQALQSGRQADQSSQAV